MIIDVKYARKVNTFHLLGNSLKRVKLVYELK
jgi:hypothetical protein